MSDSPGINVSMTAASSQASCSIGASGKMVKPIEDSDIPYFFPQGVLTAAKKLLGDTVNGAFCHDPVTVPALHLNIDNMYEKYGKAPVSVVYTPVSARIVSMSPEAAYEYDQDFSNISSVDATFNCSLSESVTNSVSTTKTEGDSLGVSQAVKYGVSFLGTGAEGTTTGSYQHTWGETDQNTTTITIGSSSGLSVVLKPGEKVTARLSASRSKLVAEVTYDVTLDGFVCATSFQIPPNWWMFNGVGSYLDAANDGNPPNSSKGIRRTEQITLDYYANGSTTLLDSDSKVLLTLKDGEELIVKDGELLTLDALREVALLRA